MKITVENIVKEYPKIDIPLPEPLSKEKFEKLKTTFLPNYDQSEVIKKMVDTFVLKLNEAVAKNGRKPKVKRVSKAKQKTKSKVTTKSKKAAPKAKKQTCISQGKAEKVEAFPEDLRLIRRFYAAVGKERQRRTILNIYRDMEKRITERKVNKNSTHAALIEEISRKLKKVLDAMSKENLTHVTIRSSNESKSFFEKVQSVVRGKEIRSSVNLLKRFIGIEGELSPDKAKVKRLVDAFNSALYRGKVCENDLYFREFKEALAAMNAFLEEKNKNISMSATSLRGIESFACLGKPKAITRKKRSCTKSSGQVKRNNKERKAMKQISGVGHGSAKNAFVSVPAAEPVVVNRFLVDISKPVEDSTILEVEDKQSEKSELSGLFSPITYSPPESIHDKIDLAGDLGRFLGYVERYEYSILLRGEKGAGKTRLLYQMMNTFAKAGFKVGCFSLEIGKQSNLIRDMRNQYISPTIANNVFIADTVPNGLNDIKTAAKEFDVVCIDSWGKIPGTKADDFDKLRKEFPKTMVVVIFQSTTNGTARGGSMPEYDAGIVIQVAEGGRAYCEKNRYNGADLTYLVFQRKLEIQPESVDF